jgi:hypothetical protein
MRNVNSRKTNVLLYPITPKYFTARISEFRADSFVFASCFQLQYFPKYINLWSPSVD